jgi:hypothetical protein
MHRITLSSAILVAAVAWAGESLAEGALAVGMPEGDPNKGFRWSIQVNDPDAAADAMKDCRNARNPRVGAACLLIGTFKDQCVAVTANGAPNAPVTAAGWAIAPDTVEATKRAMDQCKAMRKGRGKPCELDGDKAVLCDGKAN